MDRTHGLICICFIDQGGDTDFRGGNHLGVDACIGERAEHLGSDAGMRADAGSDHGNLCHMLIVIEFFDTERIFIVVQHINRAQHIRFGNGKGNGFCAVLSERLNHDIDVQIVPVQ